MRPTWLRCSPAPAEPRPTRWSFGHEIMPTKKAPTPRGARAISRGTTQIDRCPRSVVQCVSAPRSAFGTRDDVPPRDNGRAPVTSTLPFGSSGDGSGLIFGLPPPSGRTDSGLSEDGWKAYKVRRSLLRNERYCSRCWRANFHFAHYGIESNGMSRSQSHCAPGTSYSL